MGRDLRQIGEVAERTGLSLRTIRYYEQIGLVSPAARSQGGFRLYTDGDVARLELIKQMKPLDFSLEEMRDLLETMDRIDAPTTGPEMREHLLGRLAMYQSAVEERRESLRTQVQVTERFADGLRRAIGRQRRATSDTR